MTDIIYNIFPVFFIMVLGYGLTHFRIIDQSILPSLKRLLFNFAIPILLFRSVSTAELTDGNIITILASYYIPVTLLYIAAVIISIYIFRISASDGAIVAMACCFSNNLLIGFPIIDAMWSEVSHGPFFIILSMHAAYLWLLSILTINISKQQGLSWYMLITNVLQKTILNPIVLALLLGIAWRMVIAPELPRMVDGFMRMIAQMATPLALIMLGVQMHTVSKQDQPDKLSHSAFITIMKIILLPCLVFIFTKYVFALDANIVRTLTVMAVAPVGVNAYLLALNYQSQVRKVAFSIFVSTIISSIIFLFVINLFEKYMN